jgi:hypothetical protein
MFTRILGGIALLLIGLAFLIPELGASPIYTVLTGIVSVGGGIAWLIGR